MGLGTPRPTALVTGAAGFIGSHLVELLLHEGYEVVGLDNLMTGDLSNLQEIENERHFHFQIGDVREPIHAYAQVVFNLACPASPVHYQSDPHETFTASVLGAQRLIELARGRNCKVIHASTSEIYGDPDIHPQPESYWGHVNPVGPRSCYDEGKRAAETLLNFSNIDARIVRIFNTYGPRMAFNDGRVISNFITQAITNKPLTIFGDGTQTRSFCYVSDLISGLFKISLLEKLDGPINLGNPSEHSIEKLADLVIGLLNGTDGMYTTSIKEFRPLPSDDPKRRQPDISKAERLIGFRPLIDINQGIRHTILDFAERLRDN
jgi:UDP-glucuronate decarboxylase